MIRITKEFSFEAAHALSGYEGPCSHIHGHSYRLFVTVEGTPCADPSSPVYGMVMDFRDLKRLVETEIISRLDHALILRRGTSEALASVAGRVVWVDYQPTCENMIVDFAERLRDKLPHGVTLHGLRLHETATSYAEITLP